MFRRQKSAQNVLCISIYSREQHDGKSQSSVQLRLRYLQAPGWVVRTQYLMAQQICKYIITSTAMSRQRALVFRRRTVISKNQENLTDYAAVKY